MEVKALDILKAFTNEQLKTEIPEFNVGDTVKVYGKIKEGNRERVQVFEGTVIKKQGGSNRATFTVRKSSNGIGVEKTWPLHSPNVEKVEVVRQGKVRRAKLFYLRDRVGKAAKTKENIGADLKREEVIVKEEMPAEEAKAETTETVADTAEATEVVEEVKEEAVVEKAEEVKEEEKVEDKKEEAKADEESK